MRNLRLRSARKLIDKFDNLLLHLIKERMNIVEEIGLIKKNDLLDILDKEREKNILDVMNHKAEKMNLPEGLAEDIFCILHKYSRDRQKKLKDK